MHSHSKGLLKLLGQSITPMCHPKSPIIYFLNVSRNQKVGMNGAPPPLPLIPLTNLFSPSFSHAHSPYLIRPAPTTLCLEMYLFRKGVSLRIQRLTVLKWATDTLIRRFSSWINITPNGSSSATFVIQGWYKNGFSVYWMQLNLVRGGTKGGTGGRGWVHPAECCSTWMSCPYSFYSLPLLPFWKSTIATWSLHDSNTLQPPTLKYAIWAWNTTVSPLRGSA